MAQMYTIEAFEQPQGRPNSYQNNRMEYTYWVKFQEFEEQVMVVKLKPSLQIGQQLFGDVVGKTSKKGNLYYRFTGAKQGEPNNVPAQPQKPATAPQNVSESKTSHMQMWAVEQAVRLIAGGQGTYGDLLEMAKDIITVVDKVTKVPSTTEVVDLADLPNDSSVKTIFNTPTEPVPAMPPSFLAVDDETV